MNTIQILKLECIFLVTFLSLHYFLSIDKLLQNNFFRNADLSRI